MLVNIKILLLIIIPSYIVSCGSPRVLVALDP